MKHSLEVVRERFSSRRTIVSVVVMATLIAGSAAAAIALSGPSGNIVLTIQDLSCNPEEAYVDQPVEWTVVVDIQDHGQQGKGLLFTWDWDDGNFTVYDLNSIGSNSTATDVQVHTWAEPGLYEVVVSVWDGYGPEQNAFHNVSSMFPFTVRSIVNNTPPSAVFTAEPLEGPVGTVFTFDASASSDLEDPSEALQIRWDWDWDGMWDTGYTYNKSAQHSYSVPGIYTVALEVLDSGNLTGLALQNVSVLESPGPTNHDPIVIESDDDFTSENGVIGGSGLPDDPYVISGWTISSKDGSCINISHTSAHFEIRDVSLQTDTYGEYTVYLRDVRNGDVVASTISGILGGLRLEDCSFIRVVDCNLTGEIYGIEGVSSTDFELLNCNLADFAQAFSVYSCYRFSVASCDIDARYCACWLDGCGDGVFIGNHIECLEDTREGAYVMNSVNMIFEDNQFVDCSIDITGNLLSHFNTHAISDGNTVNGRPILHYQDSEGVVVDAVSAGEVIIVECQNVTLSNLNFSRGFAGVILAYSSGVAMENTLFTSCWIGVRVIECTDVELRYITVLEAVQQGIGIWDTEWALVENNLISSNGIFGYQILMPIHHSSNINLRDNTFTDSWRGVSIHSTSYVDISGNTVSGMVTNGVYLGYSQNIWITENEFTGNGIGLVLEESIATDVYHNNFFNNSDQAQDIGDDGNSWDDGYPSGGNYWSDYQGVDEYSGENQTDPGSDGIGDTPYAIEATGLDRYPLMYPFAEGPVNTAPFAFFTVLPEFGYVGTCFDFDASYSWDLEDPTGALQVRWDWENDGFWDIDWTTEKQASHEYDAIGTYTVVLEVKDTGGLVAITERPVVVREHSGTMEPATYELTITTTDAVFDPFRPYVYITDKYAKKLYFVNLTTGSVEKTFEFSYMTESLAMTPDGARLFVALLTREHSPYWWDEDGHIGYIASVDLSTQVKDREYVINEDPGDIVATSNGHLVVGSGSGQWTYIRVFDAEDGTEISAAGGFRQLSRLALHPSESMVYAANVDVSPSDIFRYDLKQNGEIVYASDSPYHGDHRMDGNVWVSPLGDELVTRGGDVFTAGMPIASDMVFIASMAPTGSLIGALCYDTTYRVIFTGEGNSARFYSMDNYLNLGEIVADLPVGFVSVYSDILAMLLRSTGTTTIWLVDHPLPGGPNNTAPVADFTVDPPEGTTLTDFVFNASTSYDEQDSLSELEFRWDLDGDGSWDTTYDSDPVVVERYDVAGTYDVKLEVRDTLGWIDDLTIAVEVAFEGDPGTPGPTHDPFILPYAVTDAVFDPVRPYLYVSSKYENKVYFVNIDTGLTERQFEFEHMTESLTITPDGACLYVALLYREHSSYWFDGHVGEIGCFDLTRGVKENQFVINEDPFDLVATSNGQIVVSSGSGQWDDIRVYDVDDGTLLGSAPIRQLSRLSLHPAEKIVYAADTDISPSDIERFDLLTSGGISAAGDSPYHGDYRMSGNLWVSPLGDELVTRGGDVFTAGMPIASDMRYIASMAPVGSLIGALCYDTTSRVIFTGEGTALRYYSMDNYLSVGEYAVDLPVGAVSVRDTTVAMLLRGTGMAEIQLVPHPFPGGMNNTAPVADFTVDPPEGTTLTDFVFNASTSYDEQDPLSELEFRWDVNGDGLWDTAYSSSPVLVKRYDIASTYNVKLEVRDTMGWVDDAEAEVIVAFQVDNGSAGPVHDPFVLPYTATDVAFDPVRPYAYVSSKYQNKVYFVNLETGLTERQFDFTYMTESLTVTPDGARLYVALLTREHSSYWFDGHVGLIGCFDLAYGVKDGQFVINEDPFDLLATSNGHLVVSSGSGQWDEIRVYDAADGTELGSAFIRQKSRLSLHPSETMVYAANTDLSPSDIERFDLSSSGSIASAGDSPYHGDYSMAGNVWVNPLGDSLVVRGGHVFTAGMPIGEDMRYLTTMTTTIVTSVVFDLGTDAAFSLEGSYLRWYDIETYEALGYNYTGTTMEFLGVNGTSVYCLDVQSTVTEILVIDKPTL